MTEGTQWGTTPQAESSLQQMAKKGMTQDTDAVAVMPEDAQGPSNTSGTPEDMQEHTHQLIERKMNQMAKDMFEED